MSRTRRALAVALAAASTSAAFAVAAPAAPAASTGGEVVLEPFFRQDLPKLNWLDGSAAGLGWQLNARQIAGGQLRYLPAGATTPTVSGIVDHRYVSVVGDQLAYVEDDPTSEEDDVHVSSGPLVALDLPSGTTTELASAAVGAGFRGGTGTGWLQEAGGIVLTDATSGRTRALGRPPGAANARASTASHAVDDEGGVFWFFTGSGATGVLAYVDFATGAWTTLETDAAGYAALNVVELDGGRIAWPRGQKLAWADRADLAAVHTLDLGGTAVDLAMAGGTVAVTSRATTDGGASVLTVRIGALGGTWKTVTSSAHQLGDKVTPVPGGGVGVVAGSTPADYGVYRLTAGSGALGAAVVLFGPNAPSPISASVGELHLGPVKAGGDPVVRTVTSDAAVSTLTVGPPTVQPGQAVPELCRREYGSWLLCQNWSHDDGVHVVVKHDGRLVGDWAIGSTWAHTYTLTGHGLFVSSAFEGVRSSQLIDIDTGRRTKLPYTAAIHGDDIFYVTPQAEIRRRNLVTGAETTLRAAGVPATAAQPFDIEQVHVDVSGDWVRWFFQRKWVEGGFGPHTESVALNLKTRERHDFTAYDAGYYAPDTLFVAGSLAWLDAYKQVHHLNLTTGQERVVGTSDAAGVVGGRTFALTSEFLAWMDADYRIHLLPLGGAPAGTPRFGGTVDQAAFTPAGGEYDPAGDTNRPLSSWALTIRSAGTTSGVVTATAAGTPVRTLKGSARDGEVRPTWDGRDANGRKVPDGLYTWTLTGTGAGGGLTVAAGGTKPITGTVRVDSTTPVPALTLAKVAARTAPARGIDVRWPSAERGVKFTVRVARGTRDRNGILRWSKRMYWKKGTTAAGARYGAPDTWVPYEVRDGRSYRFTVTAVDRVGNTRSVTRTVVVPK